MAYEPGGYADKLGNRYEGRWVVKQLLRLLWEQVMYVTIEAVGDDQDGVDVWVTRHDGHRQAQQCKARNGSENTWAVADLNSRDVLAAMRRQLDRHDCNEFAFVSAVPATTLGDICESARQSAGDSEAFFHDQIDAVGEARRKAFRQFCQYLDLDASHRNGRAAAYGYLKRTHFILWPDDQNSREELSTWAGMLVTGDPENALALLADYAQNNLRRNITSSEIRQRLSSHGFQPRRIAHDARISPAVEVLQSQFEESVAPGLIAHKLIPRQETSEVLEGLRTEGVVVLHGPAGCGKTGVLYELTQKLREEGKPFIPVRLDRKDVGNTPQQFGDNLGLPESPALCLEALVGQEQAVLILDQLDALRWTGAHSAKALDVCKSVVRELRNLRDLGKQIGVVLASRTFDIENDPEIKNWLTGSHALKAKTLEIKPLPEDMVKRVVEEHGGNVSGMTTREKGILRSPLHLAMWATLASSGEARAFRSGTQLMRQFWDSRYDELDKAGVSAARADEVIGLLVNYMERNDKLSAPRSVVDGHPKELGELHSCGILRTAEGRVSFCHQSYLDFRIALRLLREVRQGTGTVRAWLGGRAQQTLHRREQLRQVLSLLEEDSQGEFLAAAKDILEASEVRFYLKHLVLEIIGQVEAPTAELFSLVHALMKDDFWKDRINDAVLIGHPQYVEWLANTGVLAEWLDSRDEDDVNVACWLLRSVANRSPDFVTDFLHPYADRSDEWANRVLGCLSLEEADDSERMFQLRLRLARRGLAKEWVEWHRIANKSPLRAVQLLEAHVSSWRIDDSQNDELGSRPKLKARSRLEQLNNDDLKALIAVAIEQPVLVWDQFMPHIERLTAVAAKNDRGMRTWQNVKHLHVHEGYTGTARGIVELVTEAGRTMANSDNKAVLSRVRALSDSPSTITQTVILEVLAHLPAQVADEALSWVMADPKRLTLGPGEKEPEWMPAVRLIKAQSLKCSEGLFRRLEDFLIHYHSPNERRNADWCLKGWRDGWFHDFWGRAQHFFLPALCPCRRSKQTTDLIGVLQRKFEGYEPWRFLRGGHISGGFVGSTLPGKNIERVSDKSWLEIVSNKKVPTEHGRWSKQVGEDSVAESSVRTFSRDLAGLARRFPDRFGRLALRFPKDVHPAYVAAILEGVKVTEPKQVPEAEKAAWMPASADLVEAVLAKFCACEDREVASAVCWLFHDRADENWSPEVVERLFHYATEHRDPEPEQLNSWRFDQGRDVANATVHGLVENALNCVRGVGTLALGQLLRHNRDWYARVKPCLSRSATDPHPVVRTAALEACLPVLNIDRDQAIQWFCTASQDDLRVPASRAGVYFFNCCIQSHEGQLGPIIRQMLASNSHEVVEEGAEEVTARWLFHGMFQEELNVCRRGSVPQRKGLARIASAFLLKPEYMSRCEDLLLPLYDDEDADVRRETSNAFRRDELFTLPEAERLVGTYINSRAFADDPSPLIWSLKKFPGSLLGYAELILRVCEVFGNSLNEASRDLSRPIAGDAHSIPPILLRLYDHALAKGDRKSIERCLDAWDTLFENRVGVIRDLTQAIER